MLIPASEDIGRENSMLLTCCITPCAETLLVMHHTGLELHGRNSLGNKLYTHFIDGAAITGIFICEVCARNIVNCCVKLLAHASGNAGSTLQGTVWCLYTMQRLTTTDVHYQLCITTLGNTSQFEVVFKVSLTQ